MQTLLEVKESYSIDLKNLIKIVSSSEEREICKKVKKEIKSSYFSSSYNNLLDEIIRKFNHLDQLAAEYYNKPYKYKEIITEIITEKDYLDKLGKILCKCKENSLRNCGSFKGEGDSDLTRPLINSLSERDDVVPGIATISEPEDELWRSPIPVNRRLISGLDERFVLIFEKTQYTIKRMLNTEQEVLKGFLNSLKLLGKTEEFFIIAQTIVDLCAKKITVDSGFKPYISITDFISEIEEIIELIKNQNDFNNMKEWASNKLRSLNNPIIDRIQSSKSKFKFNNENYQTIKEKIYEKIERRQDRLYKNEYSTFGWNSRKNDIKEIEELHDLLAELNELKEKLMKLTDYKVEEITYIALIGISDILNTYEGRTILGGKKKRTKKRNSNKKRRKTRRYKKMK
jgi:hypothetical protein